MKTRTLGAFVALLLFGLITAGIAQPSPNADGALLQRFPLPTYTPPLSGGMSYDVMMGYVIGDSVARGLYMAQRDSLLRGLTYSDTLRYAVKYLYEMVDYDPIRFYQWGSYRPVSTMYPSAPALLRNKVVEKAKALYPDNQRTAMLSDADVIAHVNVTSTQTKVDSLARMAKHAVVVTATVIDPIKGHRIPNCWIDSRTKKGDEGRSIAGALVGSEGDQPASPGACLQFEYRLEWPRLNHSMMQTSMDSTLVDDDGKQWVQPNTEYIIFLHFLGLSRDDKYDYAALIPVAWFGTTCSMYPVIGGHVYDPHNDFGFGSGLTVEQFKEALRSRISSIIHP